MTTPRSHLENPRKTGNFASNETWIKTFYVYVYAYVYLSIYLSIYLPIYLSIYLSIYLPACVCYIMFSINLSKTITLWTIRSLTATMWRPAEIKRSLTLQPEEGPTMGSQTISAGFSLRNIATIGNPHHGLKLNQVSQLKKNGKCMRHEEMPSQWWTPSSDFWSPKNEQLFLSARTGWRPFSCPIRPIQNDSNEFSDHRFVWLLLMEPGSTIR